MKEILRALLCLFFVTAPCAAHATETSGNIPLGKFRGMQPTIKATVAGHEGTFFLDTGGGVTIISPTLAKSVNCDPWGNVVGLHR